MTHRINHLEQRELPLQQGMRSNSAITTLAQTVIAPPLTKLTDAEKLEQFSIELGHGPIDGAPSHPVLDEEFDDFLSDRLRSQAATAKMSDELEFHNEPLSLLGENDSFGSYGLSNVSSAPSTLTTTPEESAVFVSTAELGKQLLADEPTPVKQSRLVRLLCFIPKISKAVQALLDLIANNAALISMGRSLDERLSKHLEFPGSTSPIKASLIESDFHQGVASKAEQMQKAEEEFNQACSQMGGFEKALLRLAMACMGIDSIEGKVTGARYVREYLGAKKEKFDAKQEHCAAQQELLESEARTRDTLEAQLETELAQVHAQMVKGRTAIASKELTQWLALYEACLDKVSKKTLSLEEITSLREDLLDLEKKAGNVLQTSNVLSSQEDSDLAKGALTHQEDLSSAMQAKFSEFRQRFSSKENVALLVSQLLSALKMQAQLLSPKAPSAPLPRNEASPTRVVVVPTPRGNAFMEGETVVGVEPTKRAGLLKSLTSMFTGNK